MIPLAANPLVALIVASCVAIGFAFDGAEAKPRPEWSPELYRDHPLVGSIWSSRDDRPVSRAEAHERIARADVVILGEIHDNPDHHRLQAEILQVLIGRGEHPPRTPWAEVGSDC